MLGNSRKLKKKLYLYFFLLETVSFMELSAIKDITAVLQTVEMNSLNIKAKTNLSEYSSREYGPGC